ncbi:MAG: hypothetical protein M0Z65_12560 [Firmicutes bacterium]|uniref:Uncharacterized protein n=1 Tax=Melghirimyces thermohalophilus TaxID=1236220 RepID=A0A1G6K7V8_9BACL|nr:hypothetical protein [Melghirimyces thermohalophilus]MDA8353978.1 hypothetical protein [Bacillota bacterium]SDC27064.1 hypothetical protein SAMN04488112_105114 [Melghirimyces thermohalophilus]
MPSYGITLDQAMRIVNGLATREQIEAEVIGDYASAVDTDAPIEFHIMVDLYEALEQAQQHSPRSSLSLFWPRKKKGGLIEDQDAAAARDALARVLVEPKEEQTVRTDRREPGELV